VPKRRKGDDYAEEWRSFLSVERLRKTRVQGRSPLDARTAFENDYDRVVFSSSFRRLRNKAQVFSLEPHDFVRTRLTHSFEVSTIGRSLGEGAASALRLGYPALDFLVPRDIGTVVATACLLHDIGNPPFGHSGEKAIGRWFDGNIDAEKRLKLSDRQERADLTMFEGNAQAFRIATRLQWSGQEFGMNLTVATLSALLKYPCSSNQVQAGGSKSLKKFGYFKADANAFKTVRALTGLGAGTRRNPLTYLMEAADDIGYCAGDIEDVLKKGLVDYDSIREALTKTSGQSLDCVSMFLDAPYKHEFAALSPRERRQLSIQRFCQMAIRMMMKSAIEAFIENFEPIMRGDFQKDLVEAMELGDLCTALKGIMIDHVYPHIEIAHREQTARNVLEGLLSTIIDELQDRPDGSLAKSIYRAAPANSSEPGNLSANYQLAQRATDYVSGMTDGHALAQFQRISGMLPSF